jgi:hypothetical protein
MDDPSLIIADLEAQIKVMVGYAELKLRASDWHGVSDAANDLRELSAELAVWKRILESDGNDAHIQRSPDSR